MILVTGATGLSGSFVVRDLRQRGLAVRALVWEAFVPAAQALNVGTSGRRTPRHASGWLTQFGSTKAAYAFEVL